MSDELWRLEANQVVDLLKHNDVSTTEIVKSSINRIEEVDANINAIPIKCFDRALRKAKEINIYEEKKNWKSLLGLPIAVKDYNDVSGVKTTYGSKIFKDNVPIKSDATISKLEENGANPIGKSNVPEWAGGHTFNSVNGTTRNPFDFKKTAGGSSGGSAAALASGQVWLATGNDLGGSLRTPASFNGIVGLRPSLGVVPRGQRHLPFDNLWVEGPMARCVKDVALMLDAGSGNSSEDPISFDNPYNSFLKSLGEFDLPKRISFSHDLGIVPVEKEIREITSNSIEVIKKENIEISSEIPNFSGTLESFHTLRGVLLACMMDGLLKNHRDDILPDIIKNIEVGYNVTSKEIIYAEQIRKNLLASIDIFFKDHDFLICPSSSIEPFDADKPFVTEIDGQKCKSYIDWFAITFALTMTACPVISLPCGFTKSGLPVGIQIMGKPRKENELLSFAYFLEKKLQVKNKVPLDLTKK